MLIVIMKTLFVLFSACLAAVFGQVPVDPSIVSDSPFANARPIKTTFSSDATTTFSNARSLHPSFASDETFTNVRSANSRLASDDSLDDAQPVRFRSNLITKGQKSVNDVEITNAMVKAISELLEEDPVEYVLSPLCPKAFGLFAVQGSCRKYIHCRTGVPYEAECAPNTVFEASVETCVHPDQSSRSECTAPEIHQFLCPKYASSLTRLRFGDHDRLAHPTDCSKFYACLLNGQPRIGSCPAPLVFDVTTGFCTNYKKVKGCETFYDHLRLNDDDAIAARPVVSDARFRNAAEVVVDAPVRSAPVVTGSSKNFFNFEQKF